MMATSSQVFSLIVPTTMLVTPGSAKYEVGILL